LDRPVVKVSILADRDRAGICFFGKSVFRPSEDWLEREVLIALAGLAAEARQTGEYNRDAAARDLRYARGLAIQRAGNERPGDPPGRQRAAGRPPGTPAALQGGTPARARGSLAGRRAHRGRVAARRGDQRAAGAAPVRGVFARRGMTTSAEFAFQLPFRVIS